MCHLKAEHVIAPEVGVVRGSPCVQVTRLPNASAGTYIDSGGANDRVRAD
jgi:hypothetical protein